MPSSYYTSAGKAVVPGDIAYADDLNDINNAIDYGFEQVDIDIVALQGSLPYYVDLAQKWAENPEDTEVVPGSYSALHWAAKASADAVQTAADRVQTGLDAASAFSDASDAAIDAAAANNSALDSEAWANTAYNIEVEPGAYSALHWATVAQNEAASFTPLGLLADLITVDGAASGLDADLLDGQHGSYYAPLASPALSGTPTAPTAAAGTNTTQIANTEFVQGEGFYKKSNILGTVSQSGGVPTGAIIERGSNANGEYVRFADGTQICVIHVTDSSGNYTWTFPAAFASGAYPVVPAQGTYSSDTSFVLSVGHTISNTNTVIRTFNVSLSAITIRLADINIRMTAIGKWF